jgi:hypothetical protein
MDTLNSSACCSMHEYLSVTVWRRRLRLFLAPKDPPTGIFAEGESFEILGVPIRVADLFAPK